MAWALAMSLREVRPRSALSPFSVGAVSAGASATWVSELGALSHGRDLLFDGRARLELHVQFRV